jgi:hypothetical protein
MQNSKKNKYCLTIVKTFSEENRDDAFNEFVSLLRDLGADSEKITELAVKNKTFWNNSTDTGHAIVAVEIIGQKNEST